MLPRNSQAVDTLPPDAPKVLYGNGVERMMKMYYLYGAILILVGLGIVFLYVSEIARSPK